MGQQFKVRSTALVVTLGWLAGTILGARPLSALTTFDTTLGTAGGSNLPPPCIGDCNDDLTVTVNELVAAVNIALERTEVDRCPRADADNNSRVTIDELVGAVNRVLDGCEQAPNSTPTPTSARSGTENPGTTATPTSTAINGTPNPNATATRTSSPLPTPTNNGTPAATATRTATIAPGVTPSPAATPSQSGVPQATSTPSAVPGASATSIPVATSTSTATATPAPPTSTATPEPAGPRITHFGVVRADNEPDDPDLFDGAGRPIFVRPLGQGMYIIVEARPGSNLVAVGGSAYSQSGFPDLQLLVSRALGDGNPEVCDFDMNTPSEIGGVPATPALEFNDSAAVINAVNDLGCRVDNGLGSPVARTTAREACTHVTSGDVFGFGFLGDGTTAQYCLPIGEKWEFALGDTTVKARVRAENGVVGAPREIIIRVMGQ